MISMPTIAVMIPALTAATTLLVGGLHFHRNIIAIISGLALLLVSALIFKDGLADTFHESESFALAPMFSIKLATEPAGIIFLLIISLLWPTTSLYASGYMDANNERNQTRFFFFMHLSIAAAVGIAMAGNLSTTFLFYEILSLATLPLVTHHGTDEARKAGKLYLLTLLGSSVALLLPAIIITANLAGGLDYKAGGILHEHVASSWLGALLALYVFGIAKSAIMPMHRWLPEAMVAPVPVSALLHAVAVVKSGVFIIIKIIIYTFGVDIISANSDWLIAASAITIIAAGLIATRQQDIKAMLAYSTISQLSYIIIAAASASIYGIAGAILHMLAHAFGKITLFFTAGSIYTATGIKSLNNMAGIARKMPQTMTAYTIGSLTIFGAPFTLGFVSKWNMLHHQHPLIITVLLLGTALSMAYLLPTLLNSLKPAEVKSRNLPASMLAAQAISALCCAALLLAMPQLFELLAKIKL